MKYLKLFENFKESFDDDALLELFYFIDNLSEVFDSQSTEGSNTYINYNYDDKLDYITIEYGWSTYDGERERCCDCEGKLYTSWGSEKEICGYCCDGHIELSTKGIITDVFRMYGDMEEISDNE